MDRHRYSTGIIGNCSYIAHIDTNADVVWMCWPYFDSSFIFGSMLDKEKGGRFSITPLHLVETKQFYMPNTNVLCTEFTCSDGKFRVIDFAPRFLKFKRPFKPLMLMRKIELIAGEPEIMIVCDPVYQYGSAAASKFFGSNHIRYSGVGLNMRLTTDVPLSYILSERKFLITKNHYLCFTQDETLEASLQYISDEFLTKTIDYWRTWVRYSTICNFHQKEVIRSCLVLKLHQFEDTGAIIAASTTSLPESPGSGRNWDYRYCWIRDAYYTLHALANIGQGSELEKYAHYIQNLALRAEGRYSPVYNIRGETNFPEEIINLEGYMGNKPVRVGNQAMEHVQNDVYGQLLVSLLPLFVDERFTYQNLLSATKLTYHILEKIDETMNEPDAGIWEYRTISQEHCYTYLFHWAGCQAAKKIAKYIGDEKLFRRADDLMIKSVAKIESFYSFEIKAYTQAKGVDFFDASLFQLINMNYLPHRSERARLHLELLEKNLMDKNGLLYRYLHNDDFGAPESTFFVCSFWHVESLVCVGRLKEAMERFGMLLEYSNHLGLFSEDVSSNGSQWGNFPQTYSHVGLVNAAFRIANKLDRPQFYFYSEDEWIPG